MNENDQADRVYQAMQKLGWIIPGDEREVARVQDDEQARQPQEPTYQLKFHPDAGPVESSLARAAREAGQLSGDIEKQMHADRRAAEAKMDETSHGEDDRQTI